MTRFDTNPLHEHKLQLMSALQNYVPQSILEYCADLVITYKLHLHIEVERSDRLGDYHPHTGKGNHITINHNLNPYHFLITFMHELAHHTAYKKYGAKHQPHGSEWKEEFKSHMRYPVIKGIFPDDIKQALIRHMQNPSYTHTTDVQLMRVLHTYDRNPPLLLEHISAGSLFKIAPRGRIVMRKEKIRRVYAECVAVDSGKKYLVRCTAPVILISATKTEL